MFSITFKASCILAVRVQKPVWSFTLAFSYVRSVFGIYVRPTVIVLCELCGLCSWGQKERM